MKSSLIGKIEKARTYAQEPDRVKLSQLTCRVRGDNDEHTVTLADGAWHCDCLFFADYATCSHSMAMQRILHDMLPPDLQLVHTAA